MKNIFLVIGQELAATIGKRSFWVITFIFPILVLALNVGTQLISNNLAAGGTLTAPNGTQPLEKKIGYVDQAGLIQKIPPGLQDVRLVAYADEPSAKAALNQGKITNYVLIAPDYLRSGQLTVVQEELALLGETPKSLFQSVLAYNLTGSESISTALVDPLAKVENHQLVSPASNNSASPLASIVPFATLLIFYILLANSSGLMLTSVSREKENRTVEVLLLSLRPRELMLGKILGLSIVAVFQMLIWGGGGLLVLNRSQALLSAAVSYDLPPAFVWSGALYLILGFLMYASLMGAIGAVAPTAREGSQFTFLVLFPLIIPLLFNGVFTSDPNGGLAIVLSIFPFSAPSAMMTRLAAGAVPAWQLGLSLVGLALTAYAFVVISARCFRPDTLLSGATLSWKRLFSELSGRPSDAHLAGMDRTGKGQ
jgi:ABC-2 type transport system permease protein